MIIGGDHMI